MKLKYRGYTIREIWHNDEVICVGAFVPATKISQEVAVFDQGQQVAVRAPTAKEAFESVRDWLDECR